MTIAAPPGYERLASDVAWDPCYLELIPPERVLMLDELGPGAAGPTALSPVAITTPFRFLSDEGVRIMHAVCSELEGFARGNNRIAKCSRGGVYRSAFLHGLSSDPDLLEFLRGLAQAPVEPHPVSHHAMHVNYAPDEVGKNVDQWHCDAVSFDYVLMVSDPRPLKGGRFEYFLGPVEEGRDLLLAGAGLPRERVVSVEFPGPGWAVFQQGHRVLHRATRLEERGERITAVASFYTPDPEIPDPTELPTLRGADGNDIALVEWSRYASVVAANRLLHFAEEGASFSRSREELQADLRACIAVVEEAIEELDRDEVGALITFGEGE
ncbi:MAG: hypothetical protein ACR2L0_06970 [Gaiellaceae bacterium]